MASDALNPHASFRQQRYGSSAHADLVAVQFWMNGCAQVAQVHPAGLQRYRRELLATGAVLLN
jgi:hypothetical protein